MSPSRVTAIHPLSAIEGGRLTIEGSEFPVDGPILPEVRIGSQRARLVFASSTRLVAIVPPGLEGGRMTVRVGEGSGVTAFVDVAVPFAAGLHQVDNPVFDRDGNLYVTYSGTRGQQVPVSIFRVRTDGTRETFSSGIVNPTSMAFDPQGRLHVSSRFEGTVYRVAADGSAEPFATDLGVACGLTFAPDGTLYVGDRSGTIFRVDRNGHAVMFATLPPSVAAFHLAMSPWGELFVSAPTLGTYDHVYRIGPRGEVRTLPHAMGRPQGLAFSPDGLLHVTDALAGAGGLYRFRDLDGEPELVVSGNALVGVGFGPSGELAVATNETAYRFGPRRA